MNKNIKFAQGNIYRYRPFPRKYDSIKSGKIISDCYPKCVTNISMKIELMAASHIEYRLEFEPLNFGLLLTHPGRQISPGARGPATHV